MPAYPARYEGKVPDHGRPPPNDQPRLRYANQAPTIVWKGKKPKDHVPPAAPYMPLQAEPTHKPGAKAKPVVFHVAPIDLSTKALLALQAEADQRGVKPQMLVTAVLEAVFSDNLVTAVLDQ